MWACVWLVSLVSGSTILTILMHALVNFEGMLEAFVAFYS
jgi:hypothetical protein